MLQYGTGRYGGYAAPYTPFRRNRVAITYPLCELSTSIPSEQPFCALHVAQPDRFQRNTGSTLRVMPTLMCARVTSLDSAQALPKYREGSDLSPPNPTAGVTLPRPPLRTFCPKNPTWEKHSPWTLSPEGMRQRIF